MLASDRLRRFTRRVHIPRVSTMVSSSGSGVFVGAAGLNWGSTCMFESIDMKDCSDKDESGGAYGYKVKSVAAGSQESSQTVTNATTGCGKVRTVYREKIDFEN